VNRTRTIGLAAASCVVGLLLLAGSGLAAKKATVTLTVGLTQDFDTLNPAVGQLVPDYDVWNLQYATLTRKSAKDF